MLVYKLVPDLIDSASSTPTAGRDVGRTTILASPLSLPLLVIPAWYPPEHTPIPPARTLFDERVIDVGAVGQEHIGKGAPILVLAIDMERPLLAKDLG